MKKLTVATLAIACGWLDWLLYHRWLWWIGWHCQLATLSARLEDRWVTGYWKAPDEQRHDGHLAPDD